MSDIVDRLEVQAEHGLFFLPEGHKVVGWQRAADEIKRLRLALSRIKKYPVGPTVTITDAAIQRIAREALENKK